MEPIEEELYYIPKLEDLRPGYICQWNTGGSVGADGQLEENWMVYNLGAPEDEASVLTWRDSIERGSMRSRFILIPDLINAGWFCEGKIENIDNPEKVTNLYRFTKGRYWMIYDFIAKVVMIAITMGDVHSVCIQRFDCPSMNEFLYIESHLNLH